MEVTLRGILSPVRLPIPPLRHELMVQYLRMFVKVVRRSLATLLATGQAIHRVFHAFIDADVAFCHLACRATQDSLHDANADLLICQTRSASRPQVMEATLLHIVQPTEFFPSFFKLDLEVFLAVDLEDLFSRFIDLALKYPQKSSKQRLDGGMLSQLNSNTRSSMLFRRPVRSEFCENNGGLPLRSNR